MAKRAVKQEPTQVHPLFYVPEGSIDLKYKESGLEYDEVGEEASDIGDEQLVPVPEGLRIVKQELRTTKSGQEVVDVTLEVDDVEGVSKYDLRVTPLDD